MVQWLRFCAPNAGGSGFIPGQGTKPHRPQLRLGTAKNIYILKKKESRDLDRYLYTLVHSDAVHHSQKLEMTQVPIDK